MIETNSSNNQWRAPALLAICILGLAPIHGAAHAAVQVIFVPAAFPGVCAQDLTAGRPICPAGVSDKGPDFCAAGLRRLPQEAARLGVSNCGGGTSNPVTGPPGLELVLLVDDRHIQADLIQALQPAVVSTSDGSRVETVQGLFQNRSGNIVRNMLIVGENAVQSTENVTSQHIETSTGGAAGEGHDSETGGSSGSGETSPGPGGLDGGQQGLSYATNYIFEPSACVIFENGEIICTEVDGSTGPLDPASNYRKEQLVCQFTGQYTVCVSPGIADYSVKGGEQVTDLECRIDTRNRASCITPGEGHWNFDTQSREPGSQNSSLTTRSGGSTGSRSSEGAGTFLGASSDTSGLRIVARDGDYFVLNRSSTFDEVSLFVWGSAYRPAQSDLVRDSNPQTLPDGTQIDLADGTRWLVTRQLLGYGNSQAASSMRPEFLRQLEGAPEARTNVERMMDIRPSWVPVDVWRSTVDYWHRNDDGIRTYSNRSPARTDLIMIVRNGVIEGYANLIGDASRLYQLTNIVPAGRMEALTGRSSAQASVDWLAQANREYNDFMRSEVRKGKSVRRANQNYHNYVHRRLVTLIVESIGDHVPARGSIDAAVEQSLNAWQSAQWWIDHADQIARDYGQ